MKRYKLNYVGLAVLCVIFAELARLDGRPDVGLNVVEFFLGCALAFSFTTWTISRIENKLQERRDAKR